MVEIKTEPANTCPVCGSEGNQLYKEIQDFFLGSPGKWNITRCCKSTCSTLWLNPRPLEAEIWKAYAAYHTHNHSTNKTLSHYLESLLKRLLNLLLLPVFIGSGLWRQHKRLRYMFLNQSLPGRLLDIGCGVGRFLKRMKKIGLKVEGIDFDETAATKAQKKYNITVHTGDITPEFVS